MTSTSEPDDGSLVRRALDGDDGAFSMLFRRHSTDLVAFAERRTRSVAAADDIVAASFEKAFRSLAQLGADAGHQFRPWLFRIATNQIIDQARSRQRRQRREHLAAVSGTVDVDGAAARDDDAIGGANLSDDLLGALGAISTDHQEVISLRLLADLSPAEVAAALGISRTHVAVRLHRAVRAVRNELDRIAAGAGGGS